MTFVVMMLETLARSDLALGCEPGWYLWGAIACAHALFGVIIAALPRRLWWLFWGGWLAKELALDMPHGGWALLVLGDSVADIQAGLLGFAAARWRLRQSPV